MSWLRGFASHGRIFYFYRTDSHCRWSNILDALASLQTGIPAAKRTTQRLNTPPAERPSMLPHSRRSMSLPMCLVNRLMSFYAMLCVIFRLIWSLVTSFFQLALSVKVTSKMSCFFQIFSLIRILWYVFRWRRPCAWKAEIWIIAFDIPDPLTKVLLPPLRIGLSFQIDTQIL